MYFLCTFGLIMWPFWQINKRCVAAVVGKGEAELTMEFNGDMLKVFVTSYPQEAFYLIILLNIFNLSSYEMFSYVCHEKLCLKNVGFGNYGSFIYKNI